MSDPLVDELAASCAGEVRGDASLAELTTLRVGGNARALVVADTDADLTAIGRTCLAHGVPWAVVGRGSNLLVSDDGWHGVAIRLGRGFRGVAFEGEHVRAGAAEPLPTLAVRLASEGYAGFAWAAAVPGSLGGAVRMNAGAHGGELRDHLVEVDLIRLRSGVRETWPVDALGLRYRRSQLPDDAVVVAAVLRLARGDADEVRAEIDEIRAWRREHQPLNDPNCGSVFTNPDGDSAGRLIEAAGLKGLQVGGAQVSALHANFIVTRSGARAADVYTLIQRLKVGVRDHAGVELHPEVSLLGDFSAVVVGDGEGATR